MSNIPSIGSENSWSQRTAGAELKEKRRVGYNAIEHVFKPMGLSETAKVEHMEKIEEQITHFPVPPDYTSGTYLKQIARANQAQATQITSSTDGIKDFFQGNIALYPSFISSITQAQRTL